MHKQSVCLITADTQALAVQYFFLVMKLFFSTWLSDSFALHNSSYSADLPVYCTIVDKIYVPIAYN